MNGTVSCPGLLRLCSSSDQMPSTAESSITNSDQHPDPCLYSGTCSGNKRNGTNWPPGSEIDVPELSTATVAFQKGYQFKNITE